MTSAARRQRIPSQSKTTAGSIILLSTCHLKNDGTGDLFNLIASEEAAIRAGEVETLRHIVLLQGSTSRQCREFKAQLPSWVELLSSKGPLSSPAARNLMIRHLLDEEAVDPDAIVGFPDDDAWYPVGSLGCLARQFANPGIQLLLSRYGPSPAADQCDGAFRATLQQALSRGACAAIFVRASLLAELGGFHELLGLGTKLKGGEDTEFVHRAFHRARGQSICVPGFLVGHAAADPEKKATYYEGGLAAIVAHSRASPAARLALARKLGVGIWLVIRNRMPLSAYVRSVRRAWESAPLIRSGIGFSRPTRRGPHASA